MAKVKKQWEDRNTMIDQLNTMEVRMKTALSEMQDMRRRVDKTIASSDSMKINIDAEALDIKLKHVQVMDEREAAFRDDVGVVAMIKAGYDKMYALNDPEQFRQLAALLKSGEWLQDPLPIPPIVPSVPSPRQP